MPLTTAKGKIPNKMSQETRPAPAIVTSRHMGTTSAFHQQGPISSPATMMALTSLSRDQLVEVVRAHDHHKDQPQPQQQHQQQKHQEHQTHQLQAFSPTSPRVPKKAKHSKKDSAVPSAPPAFSADDDLEGFLAKGKAELGVVGSNGGGAATDDDLIIRPMTRRPDAPPSSAAAVRAASWQKRGTAHSRSFRSFASGSTAAELDCLVSVATPPGLLRMYSTGSFTAMATGGGSSGGSGGGGGTGGALVAMACLSRPRNPCVEQRFRSMMATAEYCCNSSSSNNSSIMDETADDTGIAH